MIRAAQASPDSGFCVFSNYEAVDDAKRLGFRRGAAGALAATTHERTAAAAVTGAAASTTPQLSERTSQPLTAARQPSARGGG